MQHFVASLSTPDRGDSAKQGGDAGGNTANEQPLPVGVVAGEAQVEFPTMARWDNECLDAGVDGGWGEGCAVQGADETIVGGPVGDDEALAGGRLEVGEWCGGGAGGVETHLGQLQYLRTCSNLVDAGCEGDGVAALVAGAVNIDALHTGGQVYPHPHGSGDGEAALQLLRVGKYLVEHELPHLW